MVNKHSGRGWGPKIPRTDILGHLMEDDDLGQTRQLTLVLLGQIILGKDNH